MHHDIDLTKKGEAYVLRHNPTGCPAGIEPRLWRKTLSQRVETHLALATALLSLLDGIDGDCDLEDNADAEPSLGGQPVNGQYDLELDDADDEPSLGWLTTSAQSVPFAFIDNAVWRRGWGAAGVEHRSPTGSQIGIHAGFGSDLEEEHSGAEPDDEGDGDPDFEPSLGAPEIGTTSLWLARIEGVDQVIVFPASQDRWANGAGDMEEEAVNEDGEVEGL